MAQEAHQNQGNTPSLLRQIVDEVDALDREKQHLLLMQIRKEKLLFDAELLDEKLKENSLHFSDEDITETVTNDRRE